MSTSRARFLNSGKKVHGDGINRITHLGVYNGEVLNCGEDALSYMVDASRENLRSVVYCPNHTKGGCIIRPKYHEGDRSGIDQLDCICNDS